MAKPSLLLAIVVLLAAACGEVNQSPTDGGPGPDAQTTDGGAGTPDADPCDSQTCECDDDGDCGDHEVCNTDGPGRVCECAPRYEDTGNGCEWAGAPDDPSFETTNTWTATGGTVIDPGATGSVSLGQANFSPVATCDLSSSVEQTIVMPPYARAEGLALLTTYRYRDAFSAFSSASSGKGSDAAPAVSINGHWKEFGIEFDWATEKVCLGDAAFDGDVTFRISPSYRPWDCDSNPTASLQLDHFEIQPEANCPAPGTVREAGFESNVTWTPSTGGDGTATTEPGIGNGGTRGARLTTSTLCSGAGLTGIASFPSRGITSPAIELWWRGSVGTELSIAASKRQLGKLVGNGSASTARLCIPAGMLGWAHDLSLELPYKGGSCAVADVREAVFDDVAIVDEPACGTDPHVVDGGFEAAAAGTVTVPWSLSFTAGRSEARMVSNAGLARTGSGVLELSVQQRCSTARAQSWVRVPQPDGNNGPAVEFAYNVPNNPESSTSVSLSTTALPEGAGWQTYTACLDPALAGRAQQISFSTSLGGLCAETFPKETAWIDDVRAITSASCPIN